MDKDKKRRRRADASRKNGQLGGVKTEEGKAVSKMNAVKHGLLSNITSEYDKVDVKALYNKLADEYSVTTMTQKLLLEQLVLTYVKLSRCSRIETEVLREALSSEKLPSFENGTFSVKQA